ncbi:hypothetical protein L5G32_14630 [Gordonia sp. HY002]|uniref:hypothetical protein n=1 Tax=Gordonia zhenghanii TaxID=2911516 RepID=UPI001F3491F6|nr:hypothetical protein [Gordonia zhenghanii]MCF8571506.1 hypothetical protein [Gordonia zhenghanii]
MGDLAEADDTHTLVYASVASWEYGCCGELPVPGARFSGTLCAAPARPADRFVVTQPFTWIADLELIRFDTWSAHWDRTHGDPTTQPITVRLSWHDDSGGVHPTATGTVLETYEVRDETPIAYRSVEVLERHHYDIDPGLLGLVVGLRPDSCTEPTAAAIADRAAQIERWSRGIGVTGPADAFGDTAPARDDRVRIDLDDPRLRVDGSRAADLAGVVSGIVTQAKRGVPDPSGFVAMVSVPAGTATSSIDADLYVSVLVDQRHFS